MESSETPLSWNMYTHILSFFMYTQLLHVSQSYHFRHEMSFMKRWKNRDSTLFTLSVFQQTRTHNHLYRASKWEIEMRLQNVVANYWNVFIPVQESSGRIIFLNCYPTYAREILCRVCANCSCPFQKDTIADDCLTMHCRPPHWAWCHQGMLGSHTDGIQNHFGSRTQAIRISTRSLISAAESRLSAL